MSPIRLCDVLCGFTLITSVMCGFTLIMCGFTLIIKCSVNAVCAMVVFCESVCCGVPCVPSCHAAPHFHSRVPQRHTCISWTQWLGGLEKMTFVSFTANVNAVRLKQRDRSKIQLAQVSRHVCAVSLCTWPGQPTRRLFAGHVWDPVCFALAFVCACQIQSKKQNRQ